MEELQKDVAIRVFAKEAKKHYREWLAYREFVQQLKSNGFEGMVEEILDDARRSAQVQKDAAFYESVIDARIPPSVSDRLEEEVRKALAALPLTGPPN
ncbi:MAG TPA: hypothetical protein VIJ79_03880 [Acidobacteriaceae bacterium]